MWCTTERSVGAASTSCTQVSQGDKIVPPLIEILENAAERNSRFFKETAYTGHLYAIHILAQLRAPEAHIPLLQFCSVPPRLVETIFGEEFLENELERALAATADGDPSGLVRLIEDSGIHDDIRRAAVDAFVRMAAFGDIDRQETMSTLSDLFDHMPRKASPVWEDLALAARFLAAEPIRKAIYKAWKDGWISGDWKEISKDLKADWEVKRPELQKHFAIDGKNERADWWSADSRRLATSGLILGSLFDYDEDGVEIEDEEFDEDDGWEDFEEEETYD